MVNFFTFEVRPPNLHGVNHGKAFLLGGRVVTLRRCQGARPESKQLSLPIFVGSEKRAADLVVAGVSIDGVLQAQSYQDRRGGNFFRSAFGTLALHAVQNQEIPWTEGNL